MGRKKIQMEKLPSKTQRKVTYGKRSKGLIKKAHEISVLSDVEISLIMFSCNGKLDQFSSQPGIWKILQRFIQNIPDNERRLISQDNINTINMLAEQHGSANRSRKEIKKEIIDNDTRNILLQLRNRMMDPSREVFKSKEGFEGLIQHLENIRQMVVNRKMQMQQILGGSEAGMRGPLQVQEQIQQQGVQIFRVGDPSPSSNSAQLVKLNVAGSPYVDMSYPLTGGHREWMLEDRTMGDPCSSAYAATKFSTGQQNIMDPQSLPVKIESLSSNIPEVILAPLPEEYQEQNTLQGIDFSCGVQATDGQPSTSTCWNKIYNVTQLAGTAQTNPETFNTEQEFQGNIECHEDSGSTIANRMVLMQQSRGVPEARMWIPQQGGEHMLQQGFQEFGMGNLYSSSVPLYSAQQNAWTG